LPADEGWLWKVGPVREANDGCAGYRRDHCGSTGGMPLHYELQFRVALVPPTTPVRLPRSAALNAGCRVNANEAGWPPTRTALSCLGGRRTPIAVGRTGWQDEPGAASG